MKSLSVFFIMALLSAGTFAQIKILDNNNVAIHSENALSKVSVGNEGSSIAYFNIYNDQITDYSRGLNVLTDVGAVHRYGIVVSAPAQSGGFSYGLYGSANSSTSINSGRSYGLYGIAGNASSGWNYGVFGRLYGSLNGAGVFGTISGDCATGGRYAGYFYGDVKITGDAWVNGSTVVTSDIRAKKDIKNLDKDNASKLKQLNGIKYKLKQPQELDIAVSTQTKAGTDTVQQKKLDPEIEKIYNKERIGLNAQEVREVYPELVVESQDGTLGVDYIGLIPVLIEAIKEQQTALDMQKKEIEELKKKLDLGND